MYIYVSERGKDNVIAHGSNSLKYINDHINEWSINKKNKSVRYTHYIIKSDFKFKEKENSQYALLYRDVRESAKYQCFAISEHSYMLRGIAKRKKAEVGMFNYQYINWRVVRLTHNYYEFDNEEIIIAEEKEKPKRKFKLRSQSDGSYQLWYEGELIANCDDYSEVREVLNDENACL